MGGLYTGIFTPTEAGSIGAFAAFVAVLAIEKRKLAEHQPDILFESGGLTAQILFILLAGMMFSYIMAVTRLPAGLSTWVVGLNVAPDYDHCCYYVYLFSSGDCSWMIYP